MSLVARAVRSLFHRHRVDPDLSAFVAFPACGCGALLWPDAPEAVRAKSAERVVSRRRTSTAR
jgi:hypothetical protein